MLVFNARSLLAAAALTATLWPAPAAWALPIGFYMNQGSLEYDERLTPNFIVYHDRRVPGEGAATVNALEGARPHLERWLGSRRKKPLIVITSAVTEGASFANFITDALEVQTFGQPSRDLVWHEYTHSTMYRHFDNLFGPAGNILHLPWLPTWFIEGVAELTSVSVGSDFTTGIERYQALSGDWPTFASLHSLYRKSTSVDAGYATSGALVRYLLKKGDPNKLPAFLDDLYWKSMPWWWPYSVVPFVDSLPFDRALKQFIGVDSEALYEEYKVAAKNHWQAGKERFLVGEIGQKKRLIVPEVRSLRSDGKDILTVADSDGTPRQGRLTFGEDGLAVSREVDRPLLDARAYSQRVLTADLEAVVWYERALQAKRETSHFVFRRDGGKPRHLTRPGAAVGLYAGATHLFWLEYDLDQSRLCTLPRAALGKRTAKALRRAVACKLAATTPTSVAVLGAQPRQPGDQTAREVWLAASEERLSGTRYQIQRFDPERQAVVGTVVTTRAKPLAAAFAGPRGEETWLLMAERDRRTIRLYGQDGQCLASLALKDHVLNVLGLADGSLAVAVYAGANSYVMKVNDPRGQAQPCDTETYQTSPLLYAAGVGGEPDLKTVLAATDPWTKPASTDIVPDPTTGRFDRQPALDKDVQPGAEAAMTAKPATWRARPVLLFPWIGADDALGSQVGIVSVPLMDHLQNETIRATILYGFPSNFPYQEISLTTTRFTPTLAAALYRQQTYNGRFVSSADGTIVSSYLDEKGVRFDSDLDLTLLGGEVSFGGGIKLATLNPYIGPELNGDGTLIEPGANASIVHTVGSWSFAQSLSGRVAPGALNETFDYNQVGASTTVGVSLPLMSRFSLGLEGSRTRGKERRDLMELYRPLKTFIPGSGGGYNQNSFPLAGEGNGLFAPRFGDTQGRAKANWTVPVIRNVDKLFWIIYAERLDFTAFYNYGDAWRGDEPSRGWDRLISAHGYNLDLQMESHGMRFNSGIGAGQVIGREWELYMSVGYDAIF